jgi:hypothetical protein
MYKEHKSWRGLLLIRRDLSLCIIQRCSADSKSCDDGRIYTLPSAST